MPVRPETVESRQHPRSRVQARSSRRILDAARTLVEADGIDGLSMRRLAEEADVSVQTIYNVFGDKDTLITDLILRSFAAMDEAVTHSQATDPIERIWDAIGISVEANCRYVPKAVVAAVVTDDALSREFAHRWSGNRVILHAVAAATRAGALGRDLPPERILEQVGPMHAYRLRQWAAGLLDERELRAAVLYVYDLALLTVARGRTRVRLLDHAHALEPALPDLLPGFEDPDRADVAP